MKRLFTRRNLVVVTILALTTTVMSAQDANNPWHVVAYENDKEVAFYNTEMITGIEATAQTVKIALDNGKTFSHPTATTTFGFDPRANGTGTATESITAPQWNVFYVNNRLYFSETVNDIAVYTVSGMLVAQFAGNHTGVPIHLVSGIYIVQADGKSVKFAVGANGNGGATTQLGNEAQTATYTPVPVSLRSENSIKVYLNITASNSTMSVEIPNVAKFYFTADNSIVFTLKNGNTVELADYKGAAFAIEPAPVSTSSKWDLEKTLKFGGASYGADFRENPSNHHEILVVVAVAKERVVAELVLKNSSFEVLKKEITYTNFWNIDGKLSYIQEDTSGHLTMSAQGYDNWGNLTQWFYTVQNPFRNFDQDKEKRGYFGVSPDFAYKYNNSTNVILTTIKLNYDDTLTMEFTDVFTGLKYSHLIK